jgi:hypothetical protein
MDMTEIQKRIKKAAEAEDYSEVARLGGIAAEIKVIEAHKASLLSDLESKAPHSTASPKAKSGPSSGGSMSYPRPRKKTNRRTLSVEVTFPDTGKVRICESMASRTVAALMERIFASMGMAALDRLSTLKVSRGPLLSKTPDRDYLNPKKITPYTNHKIPGSPYYVLTHSTTNEKAQFIPKALAHLGLKPYDYNVSLD